MKPKTWLVTGSNRGIGLEFVRQLKAQGQHVIAVARNPQVSTELSTLKPDRILQADVTSDADLKKLASMLEGVTIDILINNAGAYFGGDQDFTELSFTDLEKSFAVNTIAPMRVTSTLLPQLKKSQEPRLINLTSLMGSIADNSSGGSYGYRMSKTALNMFTKSLSVDCPWLISAALHPGWVKTDMGGSQAPMPVQDSVANMIRVIEKLTPKHSGGFFEGETGERLEW